MYEKLKSNIKTSMKEKHKKRTMIYKMLKSTIDTHCKDNHLEPSDEVFLSVVRKELKDKKKVLKEYIKHSREDLVKDTEKEIKRYSEFLPPIKTKEETDELLKQKFSEIKLEGELNINKLRGCLMKDLSELKNELDWEYVVSEVNKYVNGLVY